MLICEYNARIPPTEARTVPYTEKRSWDGSDYYGAGILALHQLARRKGYSLVYCEINGVNCFFIRDDVLGVCAHAAKTHIRTLTNLVACFAD